jgi:hypothetical protein
MSNVTARWHGEGTRSVPERDPLTRRTYTPTGQTARAHSSSLSERAVSDTAHPSPPDLGIARVPPHSTHLPARLSGLIVVAERSGCLNLHPWEDTCMAGVRRSSRARSPSLTAAAYHRSLPPRLPPSPLPFPRRGAPLPSGTCRIIPLSPIPFECTLGELRAMRHVRMSARQVPTRPIPMPMQQCFPLLPAFTAHMTA